MNRNHHIREVSVKNLCITRVNKRFSRAAECISFDICNESRFILNKRWKKNSNKLADDQRIDVFFFLIKRIPVWSFCCWNQSRMSFIVCYFIINPSLRLLYSCNIFICNPGYKWGKFRNI